MGTNFRYFTLKIRYDNIKKETQIAPSTSQSESLL